MPGEKPPTNRKNARPLRQRAEGLLPGSDPDISRMTAPDIQTLLHELQVHQIELELQNEELRQAQVELADSRDRYADLYEFAPVGYLTLDDKGRIIEGNLTAALLLGLDRRDLAGAPISRFVTRESRGACQVHLQAVFAADQKQLCELDLRRKDGTTLGARLESIAHQWTTTDARRCRMALIDITDGRLARQQLQQLNEDLEQRVRARTVDLRERTEQLARQSAELQRSEREFRTLANNVPAIFTYIDRDQRYRYVNHRFELIWQRSAGEITGKTMAELLGHENYELVRPHAEAALRGNEAVFETRLDFLGGPRTTQVRYVPDRDESGDVRGFFALVTDITALKHAEDALRGREEWMRTILNTAAEAILTIDRSAIITTANLAADHMFGYTPDELVGLDVRMLTPGPEHDQYDIDIAPYFESGAKKLVGVGREVVGLRKDGSTFPVEIAVSEVAQLGLFTVIIRDISARKQAEQELGKYRNDLRTMASELLLTEERERQRLAMDLHDGLGQALFLARMKLDQARAGKGNALEEIGGILEDVGRMVNTLTFELSPLVLRQLGFRVAIKSLARDMKVRYALSVQIDDDGEPTPLEERVAMVLFRAGRELLINVAKHAETDSARVSTRRVNDHLQITVSDEGKGFDPASPSRHVDAGHFGLFSLRERLEYLDGTIHIQSEPGKGTKVTLTVPLAAANAEIKTS